MGISYKEAGVDIDAGESAVERIKQSVRQTYTSQVLSDIGAFGGFFNFPRDDYSQPVLVSSTDGVGTKLKIAFLTGIHTTIGQDLVNHCVNDILTSGAEPLFFLDYIGTGKLDENVVVDIVDGAAKACKENGCALIGGEMAEMGDFYSAGEYDIAGTIVGVVERDNIVNGKNITPGDIAFGLPSTGLHTNGYTLARKVLLEDYSVDTVFGQLGGTLGEVLLSVHKSYLHEIRPLIGQSDLHGIAHITGGGLLGNTKRIIPKEMQLQVTWDAWEMPPIFQLIQSLGEISDEEMRRSFNCGIGLVVIVKDTSADAFFRHFRDCGIEPVQIGEIVSGS